MNTILTDMVPMRDGVKLFTTVHLPKGKGPFPAILVRNLYRETKIVAYQDVTDDGIALVEQNVRGSILSEGSWDRPWLQEIEDGEDCLRWTASQPWSNGKIAMRGGSYLGGAQWFAAKSEFPGLVAITPGISPCNYHESPKYQGGAFILQQNILWGLGTRARLEGKLLAGEREKLAEHLPVREIDEFTGLGKIPFWREWLDHQEYGPYWDNYNLASYVDKIHCPAYIWTGWFDIYSQGMIDAYHLMREKAATPEARRRTRLVIGPWAHGENCGDIPVSADISRGEIVGKTEKKFMEDELAGGRDLEKDEKPILYYTFGVNEWRTSETWPPEGVKKHFFHLHSGGTANSRLGDGVLSEAEPGNEFPDSFLSDPNDPVRTTGGHGIDIANGSHDQSELELRKDILVYTSEILSEDLEVAGRVLLEIWAYTNAKDCDYTAKLVDVYPDGRAFNLANGILRARYGESAEKADFALPGEIRKYTVDLWSIANVFRKGHRVRLEIAGSDFPEFDRNLHTGNNPADDTEARTARQTILHDGQHPSRLILDVLPHG